MPIKPTYPGVYIEEIPSGVRTIIGVSTSVAAFIDYFKYGLMNKAVQILNMGDFEREFGGLDSDSEASYAIQQFFLNGGTEAWVVRTASDTDENPLATSEINILSGIDRALALTVKAISEGDWGNNLQVKIDYNTSGPNLFNMNVSEFKSVRGTKLLSRSEDFLNLSMDSTNPRHVMKVVNDEDSGSRMIRVLSTGNALPLQNGTVSGGLTAPVSLTPTPAVRVTIGDEGAGDAILDVKGMDPSKLTLQDVRSLLENAIRSSKPDKTAFADATVELSQNCLRVLAGSTSESSTLTFDNPTLKELKLDKSSAVSVKGKISGKLDPNLTLTTSPPSLNVNIDGDITKIDLETPVNNLKDAREKLEKAIHAVNPHNSSLKLAFEKAWVSIYDNGTDQKLIILAGIPDKDISFTATTDTDTFSKLGLGANSESVNCIISGDLTTTFPTLTAPYASVDLKIGSVTEKPKTVTFETKPTDFKNARAGLEKAIHDADSSTAFTGAKVALYSPDDSKMRLILAIDSSKGEVVLTVTQASVSMVTFSEYVNPTLKELKLDKSSAVSVKGKISGKLDPNLTLTTTPPSLNVNIDGDNTKIDLETPVNNLKDAREKLEKAIHAVNPQNSSLKPAFEKAWVSIYDNGTDQKLIILAGIPDKDISFTATADTDTFSKLGFGANSESVNCIISGDLTTTFPTLTAPYASVDLKIGSGAGDPKKVTFGIKPTNFEKARAGLETAIHKADSSTAFTDAIVALYSPDSKRRLIVAIKSSSGEVEFTPTVDAETVTKLKLTSPPALANVKEYKLGNTDAILHTAQGAGVKGSNGIPPMGNELIGGGIRENKKGLFALEEVDLFNILCIPRTSIVSGDNALKPEEAKMVMDVARKYCEDKRAFFIVDPPNDINDVQKIKDWLDKAGIHDKNTALYFPRIKIADQLNEFRLRSFGASGTIAGLYARTDSNRGVWKAPAGTETTLVNVQALDYKLTDAQNGTLNPLAINCLRNFPIYGNICWGTRTLDGADQRASEWKYIPVRRLALFIEESLYRGTQWVVFEPNDEPLWAQIRLNVGAFMHSLFVQGAFQGQTPREAYLVKCDKETTTQTDINSGIVNILVGFFPLKPAEFVMIKIQQMAGQIQT